MAVPGGGASWQFLEAGLHDSSWGRGFITAALNKPLALVSQFHLGGSEAFSQADSRLRGNFSCFFVFSLYQHDLRGVT